MATEINRLSGVPKCVGVAKTLPLVYDDTLSYYEMLCKVVKRLNEISAMISQIDVDEAFIAQSKLYTDQKIAQLNTALGGDIEDLDDRVTEIEESLQGAITELTAELQEQINNISTGLVETNANVMNFQTYTNGRLAQMWIDVIEYIDSRTPVVAEVYVTDPVSNRRVNIQTCVYSLYNAFLRVNGVTARQYDGLELTASEYDSKRMTAYQYDMEFKEVMYRYFHRMRNGLTGKLDFIEKVINDLMDLHRDSLTASAYGALGISAEDYDELEVSAYEYDFDGANKVVVSV